MAGKVVSGGFRGFLSVRPFSAKAAASHKVDQSDKGHLSKQDSRTTTLPNGLTVSSYENYSPISRVAVIVKAGPRYESINQLGISHYLRDCAGLSTRKLSEFGITKGLEMIGANFQCSTTRENIIFELNCNRDDLNDTMRILGQTVTQPAFYDWEVNKHSPRMRREIASFETNPYGVLIEALHKASFYGGLSNSLYSPAFMLDKHNSTMLKEYTSQTFVSGRAAVVGLGMEHDHLLELVANRFDFQSGSSSKQGASRFKGGEVFVHGNTQLTYAAVVAEGVGLNNQKDVLCLAILQKILGEGPHVKYSDQKLTKLGAAAAKATSHPFAVSGLNLNYSDTGLFGFCVAGCPDDMNKLVKELVTEMRTLKKVTAKEVATAKQQLKASIHFSHETVEQQLEEMALGALTGSMATAGDLEKAIDAISATDVVAVATKVLKGKPAMAAFGQLQKVPVLEELV